MKKINNKRVGALVRELYSCKVKNAKGITLVALVITIIILLILAGVSIATLTESGLFNKAKEAKQKSENAQIKEETTLGDYENKIDNYVNSGREYKVEDYTTNMLYKTNYATMVNGQNGVTIPSTGVEINSVGNYITFDGTDYVTIDSDTIGSKNILAGTTTKTLVAWYRTDTVSENAMPVCYGTPGRGQILGINTMSSNRIMAIADYGVCDRSIDCAEVADNQWHLCVVTWKNGNQVRFWFDGVPFDGSGSYNTAAGNLTIGCHSVEQNTFLYTGDVGEIRLYEGELTTNNVIQLLEYGRQNYYSRNN